MTIIPGLPKHLAVVPPAPISPDDPERDAKRAAWFAWKDAVVLDNDRYQAQMDAAADRDEAIRDELVLCAAHPAYWLARWVPIFEPRPDDDRGGESPFVPFAIQVDLLDFFLDCLTQKGAKGDAAVSKSRDMGASWVMCAFALWGWLFKAKEPWEVVLLSYIQELVDMGYRSDPSTLFWKIDYMLDALPPWMRPAGYTLGKHRKILYMHNPANGNTIRGISSTGKGTRARRATWVGFDEYAIFEDGDEAYSAAMNSTYHRLVVSSEHTEYGDHFQRLQEGRDSGITPALFPIDWYTSPHHDDAWYQETKQRAKAEGKIEAFYREVERNIRAGSKVWVYEAAAKKTPQAGWSYRAGDPLYGAIDPGFRDQCALIWATVSPVTGELVILDGYTTNGQPADYYGTIIRGNPVPWAWDYDEEAQRVAAWTATLPPATWFGDHNGNSKEAGTGDSVYSRLRNFDIFVNADRTPEGEMTSAKKEARTFKGRKEAAMEYLPRTVFAGTPGAIKVLTALQSARYKVEDGKSVTEQSEPMHDWTSHFRTAYEYLCVHLKMRRDLAVRGTSRSATRLSRYQPIAGPRWSRSNDLPRLPGVTRG
jgi:hypothetical protein